jgi:hypothetical protein
MPIGFWGQAQRICRRRLAAKTWRKSMRHRIEQVRHLTVENMEAGGLSAAQVLTDWLVELRHAQAQLTFTV